MPPQIGLFQFHLTKGQSIGPQALLRLWSYASGSTEVSVSRQERDYLSGGHLYTLSGPNMLGDRVNVELRLRKLLENRVAMAAVTLRRLF